MTAADPLTHDQAADLIRRGMRFGDVAPLLGDDAARDQLREWYVRADGVPVNPVRPAPPQVQTAPPVRTATGDLCPRCGGLMVRTGTCSTCQSCGDSSGGCG